MKSPLNHHYLLDSNIKFYKRNMHEKRKELKINSFPYITL